MKTNDAIEAFGGSKLMCKAAGVHPMNRVHWGYWVPEKYARVMMEKMPEIPADMNVYTDKRSVKIAGHTFALAIDISSSRRLENAIKTKKETVVAINGGKIIDFKDLSEIERRDAFREFPVYRSISGAVNLFVEPQKKIQFHGLELTVPLTAKFIAVDSDGWIKCSKLEMTVNESSGAWSSEIADAEYLCQIKIGSGLDWTKSQEEIK